MRDRTREGRERRSLKLVLSVSVVLYADDLEALGAQLGSEEIPNRGQLRRWAGAVLRRSVEDAKKRYEENAEREERPEEPGHHILIEGKSWDSCSQHRTKPPI